MKLRLPKALMTAIAAAVVGAAPQAQAETRSLTTTEVADADLLYYNTFTSTTADVGNGTYFNDASQKFTVDTTTGKGRITNGGVTSGDLTSANISSFTLSMDLSSVTFDQNWKAVLAISSKKEDTGNNRSFQLQKAGDGATELQWYNAPAAQREFAGSTSVSGGSATGINYNTLSNSTLTVTYDAATYTMTTYLDGVVKHTAVFSGVQDSLNAISNIMIGRAPDDRNNMTATVDNVMLWNKAMSAAQVHDLSALTWTGSETDSTTWAALNDGFSFRTQVVATVTPTETEGDAATWTFGAADAAVEASIADFTLGGGALQMDVTEGSSLALGSARLADGGSLTVNGNATISAASLAANTTLSLGSGTTLAVDASNLDNQGTIFFAEGGKLSISGAANGQSYTVGTLHFADGVEFDDVIGNNGRLSATYEDNNSIRFSITAANLVWNGSTSDVWTDYTDTWVNDASAQDTFYSGDSVTFNNATVSQQGDFSVGTMTVNNSAITFSGNVDATGTLTVSGETTLAVADGGSFTHTGINIAGTGATKLTLDGVDATFTADDTMSVTGSTLNVSGGATVKLQAASTGSSGAILKNTTVTVNKATLELNADALGWASHGNTIILTSDDVDSLAVLKNTAGNASNTFAMAIQMNGNSRITGGKFNTFGTNFSVSGTNNIIESEVQMREASNVTLASGATLTFSKLSNHGEVSGALTIKGSGAVAVNALGDGFSHNVVVEGGSLLLDTVQGATANLSTFKPTTGTLDGTATTGRLKLKLATGAAGTKVTLNGDSNGEVEVLSGAINFGAGNASNIGSSKLILNNRTAITFAVNNGNASITNAIEVVGVGDGSRSDIRAYGAGATTADNVISGKITSSNGGSLRKIDGGTITFKNNSVELSSLYVAKGTLVLGSGNTTTVSQIRLSEHGDDAQGGNGNTLRLDEGSVLNVTGENNTFSTADSIVLAHWGQSGVLEINGGTLKAAKAEVLLSWTGTGTFTINSGSATVKGINFQGQDAWGGTKRYVGTLNLGTDEGGTGILELGTAGFKNVGNDSTVNFGNGTIKLNATNTADTSLASHDGNSGVINLIGTGDGTKFDTNGKNLSIDIAMRGDGNVTKAGEGVMNVNKSLTTEGSIAVEGGKLKVTSTASSGSISVTAGTLEVSGADASVTSGGTTVTAQGDSGTVKNVTTLDGTHLTGATSGTGADIRALGEMTTMTLAAAADMAVSNVTMYQSTIDATNGTAGATIAYGSRVVAVATSVKPATRSNGPALSRALEGDNNRTLTEIGTVVQDGGTATGTLTVDIAYPLLNAHRGEDLQWTLLSGVDITDLTLTFGDVLTTIVNNGKPVVTLKVGDDTQTIDASKLAANNGDYNLLEGYTGRATVILTVHNVPEPATGTLSVLALAALAARRRRK